MKRKPNYKGLAVSWISSGVLSIVISIIWFLLSDSTGYLSRDERRIVEMVNVLAIIFIVSGVGEIIGGLVCVAKAASSSSDNPQNNMYNQNWQNMNVNSQYPHAYQQNQGYNMSNPTFNNNQNYANNPAVDYGRTVAADPAYVDVQPPAAPAVSAPAPVNVQPPAAPAVSAPAPVSVQPPAAPAVSAPAPVSVQPPVVPAVSVPAPVSVQPPAAPAVSAPAPVNVQPPVNNPWVSNNNVAAQVPESDKSGFWVCPKCFKQNADCVGTCGCGELNPNKKRSLKAAEEVILEENRNKVKFCYSCGKGVTSYQRFCSNCGTDLKREL